MGSNKSFLELLNIFVALQYWASRVKRSSVVIYCDNMAAVHTLTHFQATDTQLSTVARNIRSLLVRFNITLMVHHIADKHNHLTDRLSRLSSAADKALLKFSWVWHQNPVLLLVPPQLWHWIFCSRCCTCFASSQQASEHTTTSLKPKTQLSYSSVFHKFLRFLYTHGLSMTNITIQSILALLSS